MAEDVSRLLQLPRELRDHIYQFIVPRDIFESSWDQDINKIRRRLPGVTNTNRQVREETMQVLLRNTIWLLPHYKHIQPFHDFLYSFPNGAGFANIRTLILQDLSLLGTKLIKYCISLRTLVIVFDGPEVVGQRLIRNGHWDMKKLWKLGDNWPIFQIPMLEKLVLAMRSCADWVRSQFRDSAIFAGLETWLNQKFEQEGKRVGILPVPDLPWKTDTWIDELGL
ncbi:hypothetical protein BDV96DRAFT_606636 [Lophiotrema nucula]|uniref:F-box domain-containing protein n=1 Tax=Lophiotrema nucula TaxID=690887 RepID=A0A6A5YJR2_9PLEO|nr:hypothetical protein BDV96DRAFT_606636 [Lophiotrema nucula]